MAQEDVMALRFLVEESRTMLDAHMERATDTESRMIVMQSKIEEIITKVEGLESVAVDRGSDVEVITEVRE